VVPATLRRASPLSRAARTLGRLVLLLASLLVVGCGDSGFFPSTVDPGQDFGIAEVVYDSNYFYCKVEPMLFQMRCGSGDPSKGDASGGCHFNVTSYRLTNYSPLVGKSCGNNAAPGQSPPVAAENNYRTSEAKMERDPDTAALLNRPTGVAAHPRVIFKSNSPQADIIRQWATKFSSQ
jgi:hypothetical protein